jgi:Ca-activated chloride channel family protein
MACLAAFLLGPPLAATQNKRPAVYVVAVKNVVALRPCAGGASFRTSNSFPGPQIVVRDAENTPGWAAPFPELRATVEREFQKRHHYALASSAESADIVFFIEGTPSALFSAVEPNQGKRRGFLHVIASPDEKPNVLSSVAAIVVPGVAWRQSSTDSQALVAGSVWQGLGRSVLSTGDFQPPPIDKLVERFHKDYNGQPVPGIASVTPERPAQSQSSPPPPPSSTVNNLADEPMGPLPGAFNPSSPPSRQPVQSPQPTSVPVEDRVGLCAPPQPPRAAPIDMSALVPPPAKGVAVAAPAREVGVATFRTGIAAVLVPFVVVDEHGRYVEDLKASDFRIREGEIEQHVEGLLDRSDPISVALVVDTSASMARSFNALKTAASALIDGLRPDDAVTMISFDTTSWVMCDLTRDHEAARQALVRMQASRGSPTALYDALLATKERLDPLPGRKALVLLTDGLDDASGFTDATGVQAAIDAANLPVFAVQFDTTGDARPNVVGGAKLLLVPEDMFNKPAVFSKAGGYLRGLSIGSGGQFEQATTIEAVDRGFTRIAESLRRQYVLYYYPTNQAHDGSYRRIQVSVNRPGVTVRAREGYRAGVPPAR